MRHETDNSICRPTREKPGSRRMGGAGLPTPTHGRGPEGLLAEEAAISNRLEQKQPNGAAGSDVGGECSERRWGKLKSFAETRRSPSTWSRASHSRAPRSIRGGA